MDRDGNGAVWVGFRPTPPRPALLKKTVKKPVYRPAPSVSTGTRLTRPDGYPTRPDLVDSTASQFKFKFGSENEGFEEAHFYASREEMENLVLDDPLNNGKVVFELP